MNKFRQNERRQLSFARDEVKDFCEYIAGFNPVGFGDGNPFYEKGEPSGAVTRRRFCEKVRASRQKIYQRKKINTVGKRKVIKTKKKQTSLITIHKLRWTIKPRTRRRRDRRNVFLGSRRKRRRQVRQHPNNGSPRKNSVGFIRRYLENRRFRFSTERSEGYTPIKTAGKSPSITYLLGTLRAYENKERTTVNALSEYFIEELRQRADLVRIIETLRAAQKKGANGWAAAFSPGKNAFVFPSIRRKVFYKCFGARKRRNAFSFLMEIEGLSFS